MALENETIKIIIFALTRTELKVLRMGLFNRRILLILKL